MVRVVSHQTLPGQRNFFDMGNILDTEVEDIVSRDITSL